MALQSSPFPLGRRRKTVSGGVKGEEEQCTLLHTASATPLSFPPERRRQQQLFQTSRKENRPTYICQKRKKPSYKHTYPTAKVFMKPGYIFFCRNQSFPHLPSPLPFLFQTGKGGRKRRGKKGKTRRRRRVGVAAEGGTFKPLLHAFLAY